MEGNRSLIYLRSGELVPIAIRHKEKSITLHSRARHEHLISHSAQSAHSIQTLHSLSCLTAYIRLIPANIHQSINKHTLTKSIPDLGHNLHENPPYERPKTLHMPYHASLSDKQKRRKKQKSEIPLHSSMLIFGVYK